MPSHFADIDGTPAHVLRFDAERADTLPLILAHGWPGSVLEPVPLARRLAEPSGHGGTSRDAFTAAAGTSRARARSRRAPLSRTPPPGCSPGSSRSTVRGRD
ncbi:epoxide hydrolase N-terminal domain-containing protein [Streptomyces evansiae]|uniref:epoxide hydrolase N-terminal domain-containing protein n=1 Tax=Streptomyces evansiae TaxID=3075535 RepID=UPI0028869050|nr:epoxide hydrolase N-terminal domain-containing protein [Streptomyces sp. DSM 41859]MDT0425068.1 epoxide hydrolase N-terminal domain-containing protein [Streptomyces sp. DSM 41859]